MALSKAASRTASMLPIPYPDLLLVILVQLQNCAASSLILCCHPGQGCGHPARLECCKLSAMTTEAYDWSLTTGPHFDA